MSKLPLGAKRFYNPYRGYGGALAPLPTPVKQAVDKLNGQEMTLSKAVKVIRQAIKLFLFPCSKGMVTSQKLEVKDGCILLWMNVSGGFNSRGRKKQANSATHCWLLIRFK